jgi:hypothetical protein
MHYSRRGWDALASTMLDHCETGAKDGKTFINASCDKSPTYPIGHWWNEMIPHMR